MYVRYIGKIQLRQVLSLEEYCEKRKEGNGPSAVDTLRLCQYRASVGKPEGKTWEDLNEDDSIILK